MKPGRFDGVETTASKKIQVKKKCRIRVNHARVLTEMARRRPFRPTNKDNED